MHKLQLRWRQMRERPANLGWLSLAQYLGQRIRLPLIRDKRVIRLTSKHARHPLLCRANTTDIRAFNQIFLDREYSCLDNVRDPGLVIDCGGNVGYSSAYFLSRFPQCEVIAIEPDAHNYQMLCDNLRPFGARAKTIQAGVWSRSANLTISESHCRSGGEWGYQVRECQPGEPAGFPAVGIGELLRDSGHDRISILKIDIEGAEGNIFATNYESWLDRVDNLVIELHHEPAYGDCAAIF
ncbi:MAG TPA: FkbM family methyltransferase, partial [Pirellulaceae bacterium]|nr:FkbM family methyltransferase [Pirellulaceae bacterium]